MQRISRLWRTRAIVTIASLAVAAGTAACGGGSSDGGTYKVMLITGLTDGQLGFSFPETQVGADAAAQAINEAGGVNGREIEIVTCDTQFDSNKAVNCATRAEEEGVVAVVGGADLTGDYLQVLEAAKIPSIAPYTQIHDLKSPISYPIMSGAVSQASGALAQLASLGIDDIAAVTNGDASSEEAFESQYAPTLETIPSLEPRNLFISQTTSDLSAVVTSADEQDGIALVLPPATSVPFIKTYRQLHGDATIVGNATGLDEVAIDQLGEEAEGVHAVALFMPPSATSVPAVREFVDDMDVIDADAAKNETSQDAYLGVKLFAAVAEDLGEVTGESLIEGLDESSAIDLGGMTPVLDFTKTSSNAPEDFPRLFNSKVVFTKVKDGALVPTSDGFVDAFTGQP